MTERRPPPPRPPPARRRRRAVLEFATSPRRSPTARTRSPRRASTSPRRVRHRRRAVGLRQVHAAADRVRPRHAVHGIGHRRPRAASATCSRTPRCCRGARSAATSSCSPSSRACRKAERADRRVAENVTLVGLERVRGQVPQAALGRHADAGVARPLAASWSPSVFLFDEPFGALDEITRERLNDELLGLFQRKGFGALFITHSIYEAVFLSTRVLVMSASGRGASSPSFDVPFAYPRSPRPALRRRRSPRWPARSATPCGEPTRDVSRPDRPRSTRWPSRTSAVRRRRADEHRARSDGASSSGRCSARALPRRSGSTCTRRSCAPSSTSRASSSRRRSPWSTSRSSTRRARRLLTGLWLDGGGRPSSASPSPSSSGVTIAVLMAKAEWIERSIYPYLVAAQAIPVLAIVPLISSRLRLRHRVADPRLRDDLDLPDRHQHAVRPDCRPTRPARPVHAQGRVRDAPGCGGCSSRRRCRRSSPASASRPACRVIGAVVGELFFREGDKPGLGVVSSSSARRPASRRSTAACS